MMQRIGLLVFVGDSDGATNTATSPRIWVMVTMMLMQQQVDENEGAVMLQAAQCVILVLSHNTFTLTWKFTKKLGDVRRSK